MKILAISGQNLASLAGKFELRLAEGPLARAGLFAITGPTGAGKSTLLDALCLALFAKTPRLSDRGGTEIGAEGEEYKLRANDARNIVRRGTSVGWAEVEFLGQDDRRYRARWTARRARDRVDGRFQPQEWRLYEADTAHTIGGAGTEETRREIEARLGLTYEQFKRSALLAQGDFAAFLMAPPDERAELLERVTGTEIYTDISIAAHRKHAECVQRIREQENLLGGVNVLGEPEREVLALQMASQERMLTTAETHCRDFEMAERWHTDRARLQACEQEAELTLANAQETRQAMAALAAELACVRAAEPHRAAVAHLDQSEKDIADGCTLLATHMMTLAAAEKVRAEADVAVAQAEEIVRQEDAKLVQTRPQLVQARQLDVLLQAAQQQAKKGRQIATEARQAVATQVDVSAQRARELADLHTALAQTEGWLAAHVELKPLAAKWGRWQKTMEDYCTLHTSLVERLKERTKLARQEAKTAKAFKESIDKEKALREALDVFEGDLVKARGRDLVAERSALQSKRSDLNSRRDVLQRVLDLAREARRLEHELATETEAGVRHAMEVAAAEEQQVQARAELAKLGGQLEEARRSLELLHGTRDLAEWRRRLVESEPCPLCGALDHPYAHQAPSTRALTVQAKRVHDLEARWLTLVRVETEAGAHIGQGRSAGDGIRKRAAQMAKELKGLQAAWKKAISGQKHFTLPTTVRKADPAQLEKTLQHVVADHAGLEAKERQLEAAETAIMELQQQRDAGQKALENAVSAGRQVERNATEAKRNLEENGRERDKQERQQTQQLAELRKAFAKRVGWLEALQADPTTFLRRASAEIVEWGVYSDKAQKLSGEVLSSDVAARAAATILHDKEQQATADETTATACERTLENLAAQRRQVLGGQNPATVEKALAKAEKEARTAQELAKSNQTKAVTAVAGAQATCTACEATLAKTTAAHTAHVTALEKTLTAAGIDLPALRLLLVREPAWVMATDRQCQEAHTAVTRAETTFQERRTQREAHEASTVPAASVDEVAVLLAEARTSRDRCREEMGETRRQLLNDDEARHTHRQHVEALERLRGEVRPWEELNTVIGSSDGKAFRMFAQGLTLGMLLALANEHLRDLAPRYRLMKVPSHDLEIQVIDMDMGEEIRGTRSLSGGETFLVSLALALGLSSFAAHDTRIRSLFIDEGFGSLDAQTLEIALATLDALQATGRQVGIISHVPGLGERLGVQVTVAPAGGGRSTLSIQIGT
ncbi:MAG: AAA family ATPase [Candidatus Tectimicrobiota bacterium]